ncbi:MAG: OsmC family protein [Deltaproteobacteria bacterium]|nr:OsmC family protein [Deltaproteobacteria bacterium]
MRWKRATPDFSYDTYDRGHDVVFGSGTAIKASAAPAFKGDPHRVNPEEQLVAALSSCHMLTFLAIAARRRFTVDSYDDDAAGVLEKNAAGKLAITRVTLKPRVVFSGEKLPSDDDVRALHERSHEECFIASSVLTVVVVEPQS